MCARNRREVKTKGVDADLPRCRMDLHPRARSCDVFLPLHDHNPIRHVRLPVVTWGLIALTTLAHLMVIGDLVLGSEQAAAVSFGAIPSVYEGTARLPARLDLLPAGAKLVTYAFVHGDFMHLAGNMLFLYVFGDNVEDAMGHLRFLVFYLASAAAGAFLHILMHPGSDAPLIGASGAVAGCVAAYLMLHPHVYVWGLWLGRIPWPIKAVYMLGAWIAFQVFNIVFQVDDGVSWWAHVGGLIAGAALILIMRRPGVVLFDRRTAQG